LAEVNKAMAKGGGGVTFPTPITRDGPGWRADVDLRHGVIVADIVERRERLASGLRRPIGCVART
jgi:S-DNA-T family DNA segregation ATPase FtsK/SpoIIIE